MLAARCFSVRQIYYPSAMKSIGCFMLGLTACVIPLMTALGGPGEKPLQMRLSPKTVGQGGTLTVFVEAAGPQQKVHMTCRGRVSPLFRVWVAGHDHVFRGFCGIPLDAKPGRQSIPVTAVDRQARVRNASLKFRIDKTDFPIQPIRLSPQKESLLNSRQLRSETQLLGRVLKRSEAKAFFSSAFIRPAPGKITAGFGWRRQYLGGKISYHHRGVDIAGRLGTPVVAANAGRVSLSRNLKSHGQTIVIDHGHGIATLYCHLSQRRVRAGQWVKKGQPLGRIGASGIATGPHLHFGFSINDIRVDPLPWITGQTLIYYHGLQ